jgi:hypothetical protein
MNNDYKIYKKRAAAQFSLLPMEGVPLNAKLGAIFITIAESNGDRQYDWDNKIVFSLNVHEVGELIRGLKGQEVSFIHDQNIGDRNLMKKEVKYLRLAKADNGEVLYLSLSEKSEKKGNKKPPSVAIDKKEAVVLSTLMEAAIPLMMGWK